MKKVCQYYLTHDFIFFIPNLNYFDSGVKYEQALERFCEICPFKLIKKH